jgi:alpha-1,2-mannosyltransferase
VGLAVALKLTPGVFVVYLWLTGRRRAALTAVASAAGFTLLAAGVFPQNSLDFWTGALFEPDRLGRNEGTSNQSLRGMLLRTALPSGAGTAFWLVLVAVVAAVGFRRAVLAYRNGDELTGVALTGLLAVLLSPVAWIHHLVWLVVLLPAVGRDLSDPRRVRATLGIAVWFTVATPWFAYRMLQNGIPPAPLWGVLQNAFGLAALVLLLALPVNSGPPPPGTPGLALRTAPQRPAEPAPAAPPAAGSGHRRPPAPRR